MPPTSPYLSVSTALPTLDASPDALDALAKDIAALQLRLSTTLTSQDITIRHLRSGLEIQLQQKQAQFARLQGQNPLLSPTGGGASSLPEFAGPTLDANRVQVSNLKSLYLGG